MLKAVALLLASNAPTDKPATFIALLDCMHNSVASYAAITDRFDDALDGAWGQCQTLSLGWSLDLAQKTPGKSLEGMSATEIHQANRQFFYRESRGDLAKTFLEARRRAKAQGARTP